MVHYTEPITTFQFNHGITDLAFTDDSQSFMVAKGKGGLALYSVKGEWIQGLAESEAELWTLKKKEEALSN